MNVQAQTAQFSGPSGASVAALDKAVVRDIEQFISAPGIFSNVAGRPVSVAHAIEDMRNYASSSVDLADITLELPAKLSDLVSTLRRYGVAVLPGMFGGEALDALKAEFSAMIGAREQLAQSFKVDHDESNICIRLQRAKMDAGLAPETAGFYDAPLLSKIAELYYGHDDFVLNQQIFVHETRPTDKPLSGDLHFDVSRMLKFWIYLDEGETDVGAIRMSPGSNMLLGKIREDFSERLIPKAEIFNQVDETAHPPIAIEAPEGSLVIFDTDTAHGAGRVSPGRVRRIMRGHTMETKYINRAKKRAAG